MEVRKLERKKTLYFSVFKVSKKDSNIIRSLRAEIFLS